MSESLVKLSNILEQSQGTEIKKLTPENTVKLMQFEYSWERVSCSNYKSFRIL